MIRTVLLLLCLTNDVFALAMSSGTGFFVSRRGDVVTNAHVVQPCHKDATIYMRRGNERPVTAKLIAADTVHDLALLRTNARADSVAKLRWVHTNIQKSHKVMLLGYPQASNITDPPVSAFATIKALDGPMGEAHWLRFTDSARKGNSGGPLLDYAGNVVGVVTGKSQLMRVNTLSAQRELVDRSDVAVTAKTLKHFLDRHRVHYMQADSLLSLPPRRLERRAAEYVTHIFCPTEAAPPLNFR